MRSSCSVTNPFLFSVKAERSVPLVVFSFGISPTDDTFSAVTLSLVVALTSECAVSELAASELAVLVTSELGFSETVSVEATSELATGASDTVVASLEAVVVVFSAGLAVASLVAGASTSIAPSLMMASTVASLTGVGCSSAEA